MSQSVYSEFDKYPVDAVGTVSEPSIQIIAADAWQPSTKPGASGAELLVAAGAVASDGIDFSKAPNIYETGFLTGKDNLVASGKGVVEQLGDSIQGLRNWWEDHFQAPLTFTDSLQRAGDGVARAFQENDMQGRSSVNNWQVFADMTTGGYLGKNTSSPPMSDDSYTARVTREAERNLMESLKNTSGTISHERLAQEAIRASGGDELLASLTLMNFTKNLASVNRGQAGVGNFESNQWPENTYRRDDANSVFNRIAGFNDSQGQSYDRAGALYHFYGAMAAEYSNGLGQFGVPLERTVFAKDDGIENAAGVIGNRAGRSAYVTER